MPYRIGIKMDGVNVPDPAELEFEIADLDTMGSRNAEGMLVRKRVATKINYTFKWNVLEGDALKAVLSAMTKEKFTLVAPNPTDPEGGLRTGDYYAGDRTGSWHYYLPDRDVKSMLNLSVKLIQY